MSRTWVLLLALWVLASCEDGGTCSHCTPPSAYDEVTWQDGRVERVDGNRTAHVCLNSSPPSPFDPGSFDCTGCGSLQCGAQCICVYEELGGSIGNRRTMKCGCASGKETKFIPESGCREGYVCAMGRCIHESVSSEICHS
jgi:hypothetical protein